MHRAAVLLACVCSVYANSSPDSFLGPNNAQSAPQQSLISDPEDQYSISRQPSNDPYARYGHPPHKYPKYPREFTELIDNSVQKDVSSLVEPSVPLSFDSDIRTSIDPQIPWSAPPLHRALKDFNDGDSKVRAHFTEAAFEYRDDKKFRFNVIVHVVNQLSSDVAQNGWFNYNRNFKGMVYKYIEEALADPRAAANAFHCAVLSGKNAILPLRRVMEHPTVQFVCKAQPTSCDATIWAILQYSSISRHTADVLLAAGHAASIFLHHYSDVFDAISEQNVFKYLHASKEDLRKLVTVNADALKKIHNLDPNCKGPY